MKFIITNKKSKFIAKEGIFLVKAYRGGSWTYGYLVFATNEEEARRHVDGASYVERFDREHYSFISIGSYKPTQTYPRHLFVNGSRGTVTAAWSPEEWQVV